MDKIPLPTIIREPAGTWGRIFLLSGIVGILAGMAAAGLEFGLHVGVENIIGRFTHVSGAGVLSFNKWILLLPAAGGVIAGLLIGWLCPQGRLHGTNQLIHAFHQNSGNLALRDPAVKAVAAVGIISFGGSAGPEGPIAALGAAIGSSVARGLNLSPQLRRVLLVSGCAGGVGAIFQCPLGGALFATSVLYREPEMEAESIVPAFVSSVLSYSTFMAFWGFGHYLIEPPTRLVFSTPLELVPYTLLGLLCAGLAILLSVTIRFVERRPLRLFALPRWAFAGLGGLAVGCIGCLLPQIMDAQYHFIQNAVSGRLFALPETAGRSPWEWVALFGLVAAAKCIASALTVGTSGAGGLLGPSVFIGGAAGAFLGALLNALLPGVFPEQLRESLIAVGMAGVLSAAMRTPMAAVVMVMEMTGSYGLIVPLMLVCVIAYVVGRRWGLNSTQVQSASDSPVHVGDALVHLLKNVRVQDVMTRNWPHVITPFTTLGEMICSIPSGSRPVFIVLENSRLAGVVSVSDISRAISEPGISELVIASDIMTAQVTTIRPHQPLYEVLALFRSANHNVLPVVSEDDDRQFLGVLSRQAIYQAVRSRSEEMRDHLHREHAGIATIEQDEQLYQLALCAQTPRPDTIQRIPVPPEVVGKSIRETDFRRHYGAQIISVQNADGTMQCPPDVNAPLKSDQVLLAILADSIPVNAGPDSGKSAD